MTFYVYISCIVIGLLLSLFFYYFKKKYKLHERSHAFILFLIVYVLSFELYAYFLVEQGEKNVLVYNVFFVIGETILILVYLGSLIEAKRIKRNLKYFILFFIAWAVFNTLFIQSPIVIFQQYTHCSNSSFLFCQFYLLWFFEYAVDSWYLLYYHSRFIEQDFRGNFVPYFWFLLLFTFDFFPEKWLKTILYKPFLLFLQVWCLWLLWQHLSLP